MRRLLLGLILAITVLVPSPVAFGHGTWHGVCDSIPDGNKVVTRAYRNADFGNQTGMDCDADNDWGEYNFGTCTDELGGSGYVNGECDGQTSSLVIMGHPTFDYCIYFFPLGETEPDDDYFWLKVLHGAHIHIADLSTYDPLTNKPHGPGYWNDDVQSTDLRPLLEPQDPCPRGNIGQHD